MWPITTYADKGEGLTYGELDANVREFNRRTSPGWDDLVAPMEIQIGAPDAPTRTEWMDGYFYPEFNHNYDLCILGTFHVNHRYRMNTMLYPHLHFSVNDDSVSGVIHLGFRYKLGRRHDSTGQIKFTAPVELELDFIVPLNSAGTHFVAELPEGYGIPSTHIEPDVLIMLQTFRRPNHANDSLVGSIWGFTHDIHYEVDSATTPLRAPPFWP